MVAKMGAYDAALLVSGDADFLPVVRFLKDNMKWVYLFTILPSREHKKHYLSPDLRAHVDLAFHFGPDELRRFLIPSKLPPYARGLVEERT